MNPTEKAFLPSRKQLHRLNRIVWLMKQNPKVTLVNIIDNLRETTYDAGMSLECGPKTVYRDLQVLRDEYQCPIEYDASLFHYVMTDKKWDLPVPALMNDTELLAAVVGAWFLRNILPKDASERIDAAVGSLRDSNSSATLTASRLESLKIMSVQATNITCRYFQTVFDAWSRCRRLDITYKDTRGKISKRLIDPHALVYHGVNWYVLAYCHKANNRRMFTMTRVKEASITEDTFEPSAEIINSFSPDELLIFATVRDIRIRLTPAGEKFAKSNPLHPQQELQKQEDGTYILKADVASEKDAVAWVMQQCGEAVPLAPEKLVTAVTDAARKLVSGC